MSCTICTFPPDRRKLLEKLYSDGRSVEDLGVSFRVDFDVVQTHVVSHVQATSDHTTRTEEVLDELQDMVEVARLLAESEPKGENISAYGSLVKLYHSIAMDMKDRNDKELEQAKEAQVVIDAIITQVLNPLLTDAAKVMISELSKLKELLHRSSTDANIDAHFNETTRRLGAQLNDSISPYIETVNTCVNGSQKKKRKR